jgi:hypothetical protein
LRLVKQTEEFGHAGRSLVGWLLEKNRDQRRIYNLAG